MSKVRTLVAITLAVATLCCTLVVALGIVLATGESEPPGGIYPLGIAPSQATRITNPEKRELWENEFQRELTALAEPSPQRNLPFTPPPETPIPAPTGIFPHSNPIKPFIFNNTWTGYFDGSRVAVFAGYDTRDGAGAIYVWREPRAENEWFKTTDGSGALRIVAASGDRITLVAESGATYTLDLTVSSLTRDAASP